MSSAPIFVKQAVAEGHEQAALLACAMDSDRRFGGLARLYGDVGAQRIWASHVAVVGLGGVGSWAAEALARSGVRRLTLIDMDHVAESNINRQVQALDSTLGQAKVIAMRDRIALINPLCELLCVDDFVTPDNWPEILPAGVEAVIDACDQVRAKVAMAAWARANSVPFVTVGAAGGKRHAHQVEVGDLSSCTHDPLLAQLRYRLRRERDAPSAGKKFGISCVFSRESVSLAASVNGNASDHSLNCHGYGSSVGVTATFGLCAASWLLDQIGLGSPEYRKKRDTI